MLFADQENYLLLLEQKLSRGKREERLVRLIADKLEKGEKVTYRDISSLAKKLGWDIKKFVEYLAEQFEALGIAELPNVAALLDDAAKKAAGFKSRYEYQEYLAKQKGFKSYFEYLEHLAKQKGFDAGTRFVSIVRSLEELGMPIEIAIKEAGRVIKFPTQKGKKRALEMLERAREKGI